MKKLIAIFVCLVLSLGLFACTGDVITLKVWGSKEDEKMVKEMLAAYEAANPDKKYDFDYKYVGEGEAKEHALKDLDATADVFSFSNDQLKDLVNAGVLSEIGGTYKTKIEEEILEDAVGTATYKDKLYAFPATADNGYFMYYDKSAFPTPPTKLDDIVAYCKANNKKFAMKTNDGWILPAFFLATGCSFSAEEKIDFNNANGLAAATALNKLNKEKDTTGTKILALYNNDEMISGFASKSVVAAVTGSWNAEAFKEKLGDNYAATKLPSITVGAEQKQLKSFRGTKLIGVKKSSKFQAEATKVAQWLTNEANQAKRFADRAMGPANKKVAATDAVKANIALAALALQAEFSVHQTTVPAGWWDQGKAFGTDLDTKDVADSALQAMLDSLVNVVNNPIV